MDANETPQEVNISNQISDKCGAGDSTANEGFMSGNQEHEQSDTVLGNADPAVIDFSQTISSHLKEARQLGLFDHLIVVAPSETPTVLLS